MKSFKAVPSWATNIIRNYREQAQIPTTVSDERLYTVIMVEDVELIDSNEEQLDFLRDYFNLN